MAVTQGAVTPFYVGQPVEWSQGTLTRYVYAGGQRLTLRRGVTLAFLLADTLGSTTLTPSATGTVSAEVPAPNDSQTRSWVEILLRPTLFKSSLTPQASK